MNESIFQNICKDDFYFINKHDINWLVIKNYMGEYMYYDVDEINIEKPETYIAYSYQDIEDKNGKGHKISNTHQVAQPGVPNVALKLEKSKFSKLMLANVISSIKNLLNKTD